MRAHRTRPLDRAIWCTTLAACTFGGATGVGCRAESPRSAYAERVNSILEERREAVRECYERGVASQFGLVGGDVTVRFVIGTDGRVKAAEAVPEETDLKHPPTLACVLDVVRSTEFPPPAADTAVVYPMEFGW